MSAISNSDILQFPALGHAKNFLCKRNIGFAAAKLEGLKFEPFKFYKSY
jgi:hypothetical protein